MATEINSIELAYTGPDYFGCFGPVGQPTTTFFTPTDTQVMDAAWRFCCGFDLDAAEQTIIDLCFAGV